jgi:hypothetical protein
MFLGKHPTTIYGGNLSFSSKPILDSEIILKNFPSFNLYPEVVL